MWSGRPPPRGHRECGPHTIRTVSRAFERIQRMLRKAVLCVPVLTIWSVVPARACSCVGTSTWTEAIKSAAVVVVGQVVSIGEVRRGGGVPDPESIEIEVQSVRKGRVSSQRIRVWNEMAGSSCGGALLPLAIGVRASVALLRVSDVAASRQRLWELLTFRPPVTDYLIAPYACGPSHQILKQRAGR